MLRFWRADQHLTEADRLLTAWASSCNDHVVCDHNGKIRFPNGWPEIPQTLPVVTSDALHNLRAALDYIVYELAILDSGKVQDGTQFLIEDVKVHPIDRNRGFDARSKKYLKGLSPQHIAAIEMLQPYNGVEWTKALRDLSNQDKHRQLTALSHADRKMMVTIRHTDTGRFETSSFKMTEQGPVFDRFDLEFDAHHTITVAPSDSSKPSLMETLRLIESEVCRTIELFKPEF